MCVTRYACGVLPSFPVYTLSPASVFLAVDLRIFDNGSQEEGLDRCPC